MCSSCSRITDSIQFIIGDDGPFTPLEGTNKCPISELKYTRYLLYRNGFGFMMETIHYNRLPLGGFSLIGMDEFIDGEMFTIIIQE